LVAGGGVYSNSLARWYPNVTNRVLEFSGGLHFTTFVANNIAYCYLYKNGTNYATMQAVRSPNNAYPWVFTWNYVDVVNTNLSDYYEVYLSLSAQAQTTTTAGTNNWWSGHAED
jgi:hypothetical protein